MAQKHTYFVGLLAALMAVGAAGYVAPSVAAMPIAVAMAGLDKPLVVLRFNQRTVNYQQALFGAVSQAVNAKPDVMFDLISYVPSSGDADRNEALRSQASQHLRQVADDLVKMGVPAERLNLSTEVEPSIRFDEVHVFVR